MRPTSTTVVLTGELRELSTLSRTKEAADHAGLSLPTLLLRQLTGKLPINLSASPSSNLSTATQHPMDAVVDGTSGLGTISRNLSLTLSLSTHTPAEMDSANHKTQVSTSKATRELERLLLHTRLLSNRVLFLSLSPLATTFSPCTEVVFLLLSLTAQPALTTQSPLSAGVPQVPKTTGSSETPGAQDGATRATSSSLLLMAMVSVVASSTLTWSPPSEKVYQSNIIINFEN